MTRAQYALFRKIYLEMRKESDEVVDGQNPLLRLKNIYLRTFSPNEQHYGDCNMYEVIELKKRQQITKWAEDDLIRQLLKETVQKKKETGEENAAENALNTKFVEQLLRVAKVKNEEIYGTHIETLLDIISDQSCMNGIMADLRTKVEEMCRSFEKELRRGMDELCAAVPKLDEIKILRGERHTDLED